MCLNQHALVESSKKLNIYVICAFMVWAQNTIISSSDTNIVYGLVILNKKANRTLAGLQCQCTV